MKRVINGKRYDTETASLLASYNNGVGWNDLDFVEILLYRKRTGEFFLYCEGGAGTKFARRVGDGRYGSGEVIEPITEEEAKNWVEDYANEKYETIFGNVEE